MSSNELDALPRLRSTASRIFAFQSATWERGKPDLYMLRGLSEALGLDFADTEGHPAAAHRLLSHYGWRCTQHILTQTPDFCRRQGKRPMILLSYLSPTIEAVCGGLGRDDPRYDDLIRFDHYLPSD